MCELACDTVELEGHHNIRPEARGGAGWFRRLWDGGHRGLEKVEETEANEREAGGNAGEKKGPERILAEVQRRDTVGQETRSIRRVMEGRRVCSGDQRRTRREETEGKCEGRGQEEEDRLRRRESVEEAEGVAEIRAEEEENRRRKEKKRFQIQNGIIRRKGQR